MLGNLHSFFWAECSGLKIRLGIKGMLVRDALLAESLCCVIEQDNLTAALYWFNPARQETVRK